MSIRKKLTIMFLAVAFIPVVFVGVLTFHNYGDYLRADRLSDLRNVAAFKAGQIEAYFRDLKIYFELNQVDYVIVKNLPALARLAGDPVNSEFVAAKQMIDRVYEKMPESLGISDIMLTDVQGRVVYSSNPEQSREEFLNLLSDLPQKTFVEGKNKVYFSDVFLYKASVSKPAMLISGPVHDSHGNLIGVIAARVDLLPVYKMIQDLTGLGNTGEILIGKKLGNKVIFLNPLRHDSEAVLKKIYTIGDRRGRGIQEATQGRTGSGVFIDYRGERVVGAWRYIPSLDWGIVAKIDAQEAFSDITNLKNLLIIILVMIFILVGIVSFSAAQSISGPIKELAKGVQIVGNGNLDYKVSTNLKDEIGQLSRAFDKMTAEQKHAQERLEINSQYARTLLEASLDSLVTISAEGKITDVNEATVKVTGVNRADLIGTDFSIYFTEPERAMVGYQQVFGKGVVVDYPLTIRHKDGKLTDVLYSATIYKDTRGNVAGVFAAARDVTLLNQAQVELRRYRESLEVLVKERTSALEAANKELARSNESLEQFAYVASHDLQEPLRVMASYSQLLEKRYKEKLDADAADFIGFIVDAASRMQKLITDLLSYSRAGNKDAMAVMLDCNEVLRKVIASMSSTIESSKAKVNFDNLPEILAYETSLMQVFQNLIGNALKFRSSDAPLIHVAARQENGEWVFSVQDNGIGIEPQYKEKIFQIFQRLHSKYEYPGTGIGLSICKKIVENSGGRIWVESGLGKGSIFYFTFPKGGMKNV